MKHLNDNSKTFCKQQGIKEVYKLKGIKKNYRLNHLDIPALKGIDLEVCSKERLALVGPSGSGKSTLLHLLGSVDRPTEGTLLFQGQEMQGLSETCLADIRSTEIGFIFQNYNLVPILSVFENVEYPLRIGKVKQNKANRDRIMHLLDETGLADFYRRRPNELSGGQRQRVAIARALVNNPAVILADEPTANLDSKTSTKILELIIQLSDKYNSTVVFSTHDHQVLEYVDRCLLMKDGNIEETQK